eukprot:TRINITY_DN1061_c0_g1_i1.p1 TRINITY_DN1061_c0_g1~~TRINITY_DN1061_c0_g1_i1.p1  ORF type:complete len:715 (+),score=203.14 TRINITY_DN1061_c0_g1_i1:7-2151(+)
MNTGRLVPAVLFGVTALLLARVLPLRSLSSMAQAGRIATGNRLRFDLSGPAILELSDRIIAQSKATLDQVAAVSGPRTFANTILPIAADENRFATLSSNCEFPSYVSPDADRRKASQLADSALQAYSVQATMRLDIFQAVEEYAKTAEYEQLQGEDRRMVDRLLRGLKRNGLHLPEETRQKIAELKTKISEACIKYSNNLNNDATALWLTREELPGLSDDYFEGRENKTSDGVTLYKVTMKYPDVTPVQRLCEREETRKQLEIAFNSRCKTENTPLIEQTIRDRHELAQLLGYRNFAEYALETRMAKNPKAVLDFLGNLKEKVAVSSQKEIERMLLLKKAECEKRGLPYDGKLNAWDFHYYNRILLETEYEVNDEKIKEYFPLPVVTAATLHLYQSLLNLRFEKVENPSVWHPDVEMYNVFDAKTKQFMGAFYLDLYPRDGKYGHAAAFPLQKPTIAYDTLFENDYSLSDWKNFSEKQYSYAAMVANFPKPTPTKPSLLPHDDVETFFHEFGHIMHQILGATKYNRFSGSSVETDFVEAPSQMLENWVWQAEPLRRLSSHVTHGSPLPDDVIARMVAAKNVNSGLLSLRQLFFGFFDLTVHQSPDHNTEQLWAEMRPKITLIEHTPGTNPAASFGHLMGGYESSYYSYKWSEVFSCDMFELFERNGVLDPETGMKYRECILAPGGSLDGDVMLRNFLGRDPSLEPYLRQKGLAA